MPSEADQTGKEERMETSHGKQISRGERCFEILFLLCGAVAKGLKEFQKKGIRKIKHPAKKT